MVTEIHGNEAVCHRPSAKPGEFIVNPSVDVMQALVWRAMVTAFASLSENIIILRHNVELPKRHSFDYTDVAKGRKLTDAFNLQSGDVVVVP